ncbi:acyl-CoA thioesterase/BAAT N-terminal domain-containing protein [Streptomyces sp. NPDC101165]|uniref:acyl-CoA thioesterase/BAAT N-terminal domain-containing protein n=1 Tax=Streptomyces sp. NPDC101165 TaxID=3366119 RepID=UPI003804FF20
MHASAKAVIGVDAPIALADQAVHLKINGLEPHDEITVGSSATAYDGKVWHGRATFTADDRGRVDLSTTRPVSGTYNTVDGMGLFWSMRPPAGDPNGHYFSPLSPELSPSYAVKITVTAHGRQLASRTLTREWEAKGVSSRMLALAHDKVVGEMFLPRSGTLRHPAVLAFGGSEGGVSMKWTAALLASHGYPTLALGYFGEHGLPATLRNVPLEYFATAARLLAAQPEVDPAHIIAMGYSRGSEPALLLAEDYPRLIHGVVVYAPSSNVNQGFGGGNAWTKQGHPIPQGSIPLDHLSGPLLAIAGADDALWPSSTYVKAIIGDLNAIQDRYPYQALVYPGAGHGVGIFPFLAEGTVAPTMGGNRVGNAVAKERGWPKVLALLADTQR